jgi:hypothetical protein
MMANLLHLSLLFLCITLPGFGESVESMENEKKEESFHTKHEDNAPRLGPIRSEEIEGEITKHPTNMTGSGIENGTDATNMTRTVNGTDATNMTRTVNGTDPTNMTGMDNGTDPTNMTGIDNGTGTDDIAVRIGVGVGVGVFTLVLLLSISVLVLILMFIKVKK